MTKIYLLILSLWLIFSFGCGKNEAKTKADSPEQKAKSVQNNLVKTDSTQTDSTKIATPKVTFVELGSVNCIPCKMMQPVMEAVEKDFGEQVKIVFYDVWKDPAPGREYRIRVIPTQVFLDEKGEEFFRHEGFFPKEEIDKLLADRGLKKIDYTATKMESTSKVDSI